MAFVTDAETEAVIRDGLADLVPDGIEFRRAGVQAAIAALSKIPTPKTLIIDLTGEQNPVVRLHDLSQVVEPDARVLVVGERQDVNFYRQVTRELGVLEYLYKPLVRDTVARLFGPSSPITVLRRATPPMAVVSFRSPACEAAPERLRSRRTWRGSWASKPSATPCCSMPTCTAGRAA